VVQEWFDVDVVDARGAGPGLESDVAAGRRLFADDDLLTRRHPGCPSSQ
jgi:hypothetical protein